MSADSTPEPLNTEKLNALISKFTTSKVFMSHGDTVNEFWRFLGQVIIYEGVIGAGKTSAVQATTAMLTGAKIPARGLEEKVNADMLKLFYSGMSVKPRNPHAFSFQIDMLRQCENVHREAEWISGKAEGVKKAVVVSDRTVWGNAVFASVHRDCGNITDEEFDAYLSCLKERGDGGKYSVDHLVYLDISPAVAHHRITKVRGRPSERDIPISYLQTLEKAYYLHVYNQMTSGTRVIVINNEEPFDADVILRILARPYVPFTFKDEYKPTNPDFDKQGVCNDIIRRAFREMAMHFENCTLDK